MTITATLPIPMASALPAALAATADWVTRPPLERHPLTAVATLGPPGTSSEQAAGQLWQRLPDGRGRTPELRLFDTYEEAGEALLDGRASHLVVANAYAGVNRFYMDPRLELAAAFFMETPPYGIVALPGGTNMNRPTVASHPAPVPIIGQLLDESFGEPHVSLVSSTSAAARAVREGEADLALTTLPAARRHNLVLISSTRTIQMVWSVFVLEN
ncbi:prephenate dehydratase domain-containing protein [Streptomyces sp. NPDC060031]|uniref:prephenate dehydratase domain-containing protein n=1 Tax=Streptomyces sp. NPDC060031 TaxID=3347043 RepID=UPI0036B74C8C